MMVNSKTLCNVTKVFWATNPVQDICIFLKDDWERDYAQSCYCVCVCEKFRRVSICLIILHLVYKRERN